MLWRMRTWARERLPKQRSVARKGRTAVCTLHEGLLCVCVCVCVQCRCLPLPSKDRTLRTDSRHVKNQSPQSDTLRNVFFCWPGDLDLACPTHPPRTLDLNIQPWSSRQRASRLINSTWRRRIVRAVGVTSRLLAIVHARRLRFHHHLLLPLSSLPSFFRH